MAEQPAATYDSGKDDKIKQLTKREEAATIKHESPDIPSGKPTSTDDGDDDDLDEDCRLCVKYVEEVTQSLERSSKSRELNNKDNMVYPDESFFAKLDSSIKKNTAFVKKLKNNLTEGQKESITKDFSGLNLSRYITEVTSALMEAKIKKSDIPFVLGLCSQLHRRYADFSNCFLEAWMKVLPRKPTDLSSLNVSKARTDLLLFAELISDGVFTLKEGLPILGQVITLMVNADKESHQHLPILLSFVKSCKHDFLGSIVPRRVRLDSEKYNLPVELPRSTLIPPEKQVGINNLMKDYLKSLIKQVFKQHSDIRRLANQNRKTLITRGELSTERREQYEELMASFQRLVSSASEFADQIDEDFPELPPDLPESSNDFETDNSMNIDVGNRFIGSADSFGPDSLWEDEDSKSFYTSLIDLKVLIPSILFKDSCKETAKGDPSKDETEQEAKTEGTKEELGGNDSENILTDDQEVDMDAVMAETVTPVEFMEVEEADASDPQLPVSTTTDQETVTKSDSKEASSTAAPAGKQSMNLLMDAFTFSLLSCVNRDMIDKSAINFCTNLNTKNNRNKLVRFLFSVPRSRLDLLPFYARLVKTLEPVMPHVANDLIGLLKQDFRYHVRKKDQINVESKVKSVRFIAEMVKFELIPKSEALFCLKMLLHDFSHHQIEMTCAFLETCGRFLFRSKDSHPRMLPLIEQMMRKRNQIPSDSRYMPMIENAYYATNPTESGTLIVRVERPPIQEYIRKLIYTDLNRSKGMIVLKQLRKLNWKDQDIFDYIVKTLTSAWNVKFTHIRFLANLISGLKKDYSQAVFQVVDGLLEDIRLMMEVNQPKFNQRRISMIKYLGELYNYRVVDSNVIFQELYSLITFGSGTALDPPNHLFRIRVVSQLLETCGVYFAATSTKKKLDCFLIYFQQYFQMKKSQPVFAKNNTFPVSMEFLFVDTIKFLRPKFHFASNLEEANEEVVKMMNQLKPKVIEMYPQLRQQLCGQDSSSNNNLHAIQEEGNEDSNTDFREDDEESEDEEDEEQRTDQGTDGDDKKDEENIEESSSEEDDDAMPDLEEPVALVVSRPKYVPCPEDDVFAKEFDKLVSDSLVSRALVSKKAPEGDIYVPIDAQINSSYKPKKLLTNSSEDENAADDEEETFDMKVMTRASKGSKPVLRVVHLPVDSDLAITLKKQEERERKERAEFKKLTLKMNARIDEEDVKEQEGRLHRPEKQYYRKYHPHPKGAPDADVIFGSS